MTFTLDEAVAEAADKGLIDPTFGYHGTRGHFKVGDYILPSDEVKQQNPSHEPNFSISDKTRAYFTAGAFDSTLYAWGGCDTSIDCAWQWAKSSHDRTWRLAPEQVDTILGPPVVLKVEPEGEVRGDRNFWYGEPRPELTADRLRIVEIIIKP
jgi:hypothetical protein